MGGDNLADTCRDAAAVWRRLAAEALSSDERRDALAYVELFEKAADDLDRCGDPTCVLSPSSARPLEEHDKPLMRLASDRLG